MAMRSRFFEESMGEDMFAELEDFATATCDEIPTISAGKKAERERVMRKWNHFFTEVYKTRRIDPEGVWHGMCCDTDAAKAHCKIFLQWYTKNSGRWEVCLGPEEYAWTRTVETAVTVTEVWKCLVVEAHSTVLLKKRKEDLLNRRRWVLSFAERDRTGPVAEISRWIAGPLSEKFGLTTEQTFVKQATTSQDIAVFLDTLWSRSGDIPLTPSMRIAFHTYVLTVGLGGWRNATVLNMPWKQIRFALVRDSDNPTRTKLIAHVLIIQNKRRHGLRRTQDHKIEFAVTFVPYSAFCLLSFLGTRALADDVFEAGYRSWDELLNRPQLEPGIDYLPLPLKTDAMDQRAIPIGQEKMNEIWNRVVLVSGLRESLKPYSLRVGAAATLNGVLEPALRNYILSHSSGMFQKAYQPRALGKNLAHIAYGKLGGGSGDDELFASLQNCSLSRDERAPISLTAEDMVECEQRSDIQKLQTELSQLSDPMARDRMSKRIHNIVKSWSRLKLKELRKIYFAAADRRRGHGLPTDDLAASSTDTQTPASRVGHFLRLEKDELHENTTRSAVFGRLLLDFFQKRLSPLSESITIVGSTKPPSSTESFAKVDVEANKSAVSTCLLCCTSMANRSSLTRHHKRHHLSESFKIPFSCPECQRCNMPSCVIDSPPAWSNHVETYHGRSNAPNLPSGRRIWHAAPLFETRVSCLICNKIHHPGKSFEKHLRKHKDEGIFAQAFPCSECKQQGHSTWIDGFAAWVDHAAQSHGGCPDSGAIDVVNKPGPTTIASRKRARDDARDLLTEGRNVKRKVEDESETFIRSPDYIPIDPALLDV